MSDNRGLEGEVEKIKFNEKNIRFNKKYLKIIIPVVVILVTFIGWWSFTSIKLVKSYAEKVYPSVYILDEDVSGKNKDELSNAIETMMTNISNKKLNVKIGENNFAATYKDFETSIDLEGLKKEIMDYGKDKTFFEKLSLIKKAEKKQYEISLLYSDDKINGFIDNIASNVDVAAKNASISVDGGSIAVYDGANGLSLNKEQVAKDIKGILGNSKSEEISTINSELQVVEPKIKTDALKTVNQKIGGYTTHYPAGPSGHNIEIAARAIDNILLMPGEEFSTEKAIGPTTPEYGYLESNTYVNGKVVKGYGGGVCQVASTLYNAELRAGILPTERQNHMMTVSYVPLGLDATLADGVIDLKFKNVYDFPVVINAYAGGGALSVELWSNGDATEGIRYEPKSYANGLYADTYLYGYNANGEKVFEKYIDNSRYQPFN
ncbi:VanW family protein [Clostridium carnis]